MKKSAAPASRRGRPPTGSSLLSREAIVRAAVTIVGAEGVGALSLRSVARQLGVNAKSLYNHIESKEALLDAIAEHVLSRMEVPQPTGDLRTDLLAITRAFRAAALSSHREAVTILLGRPAESLSSLGALEAALAALMAAGASAEWAVHVVRAMMAFMTGALLREATVGLTHGSSDPVTAVQRETALAGLGLPSVRLAAPYLSRLDHAREFEFGVETLIDTFVSQLKMAP